MRNKLQAIADEAGCSVPTVSRALRGQRVAAANRERIIAAMQRLHFGEFVQYRLGLILPDSRNPYFSELAFAFETELERHDAQLFVTSAENQLEREIKLVSRFLSMQVDGLIYIPTAYGSDDLLNLVVQGKLPMLVFDRSVRVGNFDFVTVDSRIATARAIEYLIAFGHKRIGCVKGLQETHSAKERFRSYTDAMRANGLSPKDSWIIDGDFTILAGVKAAEKIIAMGETNRPTAILTANDLIAIGLMKRLHQEGWRLPEQMSIIGFDNIEWSEWTHPALTTIAQPVKELVRSASQILLERIAACKAKDDQLLLPSTYAVEPTLLTRNSVSQPFVRS
jgi:DNA-binding LacI/PurR family transcriptional regulator